MGRGRAPCCAKIGLNKGSWMPEEDMRLVSYIRKYGHGNWRALPKLAGLLRCGKSCRLRWINYLRPDIKRGNFTEEEEDTVIKLHSLLGNKWSKIASCLPGRTDNEIKNVWNTHLKKRPALPPKEKEQKTESQPSSASSITTVSTSSSDESESKAEKEQTDTNLEITNNDKVEIPVEPELGLWDMIDDESLVDLPEIQIEPEILSLMNEELWVASSKENVASDVHQSSGSDRSEIWLANLENELDLLGESATNITFTTSDDGDGDYDPVASYFHELPPSPFQI